MTTTTTARARRPRRRRPPPPHPLPRRSSTAQWAAAARPWRQFAQAMTHAVDVADPKDGKTEHARTGQVWKLLHQRGEGDRVGGRRRSARSGYDAVGDHRRGRQVSREKVARGRQAVATARARRRNRVSVARGGRWLVVRRGRRPPRRPRRPLATPGSRLPRRQAAPAMSRYALADRLIGYRSATPLAYN